MGGKTLTRADLAEAVYRKVGLSRTESAELVEAVLDEICEAIVRGETVKLSSFATFHVRSKNERIIGTASLIAASERARPILRV